jgi:hypothetical protein
MADEETPEELAGEPVISFATVPDCEAWFAEHDADHRGFWLKIGKKGAVEMVTALDVALCHGRIDGQKRRCDATSQTAGPRTFSDHVGGSSRPAACRRRR